MRRILLFIIILLTILIRMFHAPTRTYFNNCDELITATTCSGLVYRNIPLEKPFNTKDVLNTDFKTLLHNSAFGGYGGDNGNCFFFNLTLGLWTKIFGISDFAFRTFSMLADSISVILIFSICGFLGFKPIHAALAALFLAISPVFVAFGGDFIRTYSFTTMLSLISFYFFIRAFKEPHKTSFFIGFSITLILMFFSHFLSYYVFVGLLFFVLTKRKANPLFFKKTLLFIISAGLLCIGILSMNKEGLADMKKRNTALENRAASQPNAASEAEKFTPKTITFASLKYFISYYLGNFSLTAFANALGLKIIPLVAFFFFLVLPGYLFFSQLNELRKNDYLLLLWIVTLSGNASALLIMFLSKHFTSLDIRYSIFTIPYFFILLTFPYEKARLASLIMPAVFVISLIGLAGTFNRNIPKEIQIDFFDGKKKTVASLPEITSNFYTKLKTLSPSDIIGFKNPDDFIFFTLLTQGNCVNKCIINPSFEQGLSLVNSNKTLIKFKYYGAD